VSVIPIIRREVLERVFGDRKSAQAFEAQQAALGVVSEGTTAALADTASLKEATFVTLSANAELPNEHVLSVGQGLSLIASGTGILLSLSLDAPRTSGGFRVTFVAEGDSTVAVPLTGILATRGNVETLGGKTLDRPSMIGLGDYADDTAAATGGIAVGGVYRTGSALKVRVA